MAFQPLFSITNKILQNVAEAEAAKQIIENAPIIPSWERQFETQALIRTVHHSTAIEGNQLNLEEATRIVAGEEISSHRVRDVKEILNYRNVINFISKTLVRNLNTDFILGVHGILGQGILSESQLGHFRENNAVIVNSRTAEVVFDPPAAEEIQSDIDDLIVWDNNEAQEVHPLLKAGIVHHEIVRIHPFVDLNGRTSRILATWSMYRDGYDIKRFFSLEEYYDQDTKSYYTALDSANSGDLTAWLEYFTYGLAQELKRVKSQVLGLSRDRKLLQKMGQVALNERQLKIIEFLEENDFITNKDFVVLFPKVSDDTILRDLKDLITKKIIRKSGKTKGAKYKLI